MPSVLILLNSVSDNPLLKGISPFNFVNKQLANVILKQLASAQDIPTFIIMEENPSNNAEDIQIILQLRTNPVFASAPLLILTVKQSAEDTLVYFELGATTCMLKPASAHEWLTIINNMPAYWHEAA